MCITMNPLKLYRSNKIDSKASDNPVEYDAILAKSYTEATCTHRRYDVENISQNYSIFVIVSRMQDQFLNFKFNALRIHHLKFFKKLFVSLSEMKK